MTHAGKGEFEIGAAPVSWGGEKPGFYLSDGVVGLERADSEVAKARQRAAQTLQREMKDLFDSIQQGTGISTVLHELIVEGPESLPSIAGRLGLVVSEAQSTIDDLVLLDVVRVGDPDGFGDPTFQLNLGAPFGEYAG